MNVSLTPTLEALIQEKVATGLYNNASEVVREALRMMEQRDRQELLLKEVEKGEAQLRAGKTSAFDMQESRARVKANAAQGRKVNPLITA